MTWHVIDYFTAESLQGDNQLQWCWQPDW